MHWVATTWSESSIKARSSQPSEVSFKLAVQVKNCPCCSHRLLQHIRNNRVYWFCRSCWQEMPLPYHRSYNEGAEDRQTFPSGHSVNP
ncbi:hypothetical protein F7734_28400 [Scytonema sp. UIC 10036]|uniref:hypothetical protein n=1 Tax=Scytonema sp. UIC 10036 TaxID=2304196 RepID=UPI0012DAE309|nr:hypothetical protein [Scytonema sp. UIC 10036]MUG96056.1 hypothetical protein [Scytonema sp. UIC 10036]